MFCILWSIEVTKGGIIYYLLFEKRQIWCIDMNSLLWPVPFRALNKGNKTTCSFAFNYDFQHENKFHTKFRNLPISAKENIRNSLSNHSPLMLCKNLYISGFRLRFNPMIWTCQQTCGGRLCQDFWLIWSCTAWTKAPYRELMQSNPVVQPVG